MRREREEEKGEDRERERREGEGEGRERRKKIVRNEMKTTKQMNKQRKERKGKRNDIYLRTFLTNENVATDAPCQFLAASPEASAEGLVHHSCETLPLLPLPA